MNVQSKLIARMEKRMQENKTGVRTYSSYQAADKKADEIAKKAGNYFQCGDLRYMVVQLSNGRFAFGHDLTEAMQRNNFCGGYLGITDNYIY